MNETEINIPEVRAKIADYLATHDIPVGVGDESAACSIAAINLAITGRVTDKLHPCMCPIIRSLTIRMQDRMPAGIRNSAEWKSLVPLIAGSYKPEAEKARLDFIFSEMWRALELFQPTAEKLGLGAQWSEMTTQRTQPACIAARKAAADADYATVAAVAAAAAAADDATDATDATYAAYAAATADAAVWQKINPSETLKNLLNL